MGKAGAFCSGGSFDALPCCWDWVHISCARGAWPTSPSNGAGATRADQEGVLLLPSSTSSRRVFAKGAILRPTSSPCTARRFSLRPLTGLQHLQGMGRVKIERGLAAFALSHKLTAKTSLFAKKQLKPKKFTMHGARNVVGSDARHSKQHT